MKAVDTQLLTLLKKTPQFVVPIYQRLYSWTEAECLQLWKDIRRAGEHDNLGAHFTGSIVYVAKNSAPVTSSEPNLIIDGQQRVTTVCLLLAALANRLGNLPEGEQEVLEGFSPKKIRERYLMDPNEDGERKFKLQLSSSDKDAMQAALIGADLNFFKDSKVPVIFNYFSFLLSDPELDLSSICKGLDKLVVVDVQLEKGIDNPQLVFEAMNSTGKKLSQADLIRNFMLMDLDMNRQSEIYTKFWHPMERFFLGVDEEQFDLFVRHFLTIRTGEIPRLGDVYDDFKSYFYKQIESGETSETIAEDLFKSSDHYSRIALGKETNLTLLARFLELEQIKADVVIPFVLRLYQDHSNRVIETQEFAEILDLVISYVFRRVICKIPTNSMNKTFATLYSKIDVENYGESVQAAFLLMQSYRRFPGDEEFKDQLRSSDVYNFRRRSYLLRKLENFNRKEKVPIEEYTIEHILPQNPKLSSEWKKSLGENWEEIQKKYLHTLGNLTITAYNSEYSDRPFKTKRDMDKGFKHSPLRLNEGLSQLADWNEDEILNRAERLSGEALDLWTSPKLSSQTLEKYSSISAKETTIYTLADHPHLFHTPERNSLFEKLNKSILDMDPSISRHILKLYVAYKAETNFCDLIPLAGRLLLSINVPFGELVDTRNLARDVSNISRWGNGDYEVSLDENSDFEYILGLIRQAFELQLDSDI